MPTPTYTPLASVTLATESSVVYFTEISQDYSDLILTVEYKASAGVINIRPTFNGEAGNYYNWALMSGDGSGTVSNNGYTNYVKSVQNCSATTTEAHTVIYQIQNYSVTNKPTITLIRGNSVGSYSGTEAFINRFARNAAITSIGLSPNTNSFAAGSTFKLFGIYGEVV
jgi:hypothetical protein